MNCTKLDDQYNGAWTQVRCTECKSHQEPLIIIEVNDIYIFLCMGCSEMLISDIKDSL